MDKLNNRRLLCLKFIDMVNDYLKYLEDFVDIDEYNQKLEDIKTDRTKVTDIFKLFSDTKQLVDCIDNLIKELKRIKITDDSLTDSFKMDSTSMYRKIDTKFTAFKKDMAFDDIQLIKELSNEILKQLDGKLNKIDEFRELYHKNRHGVSLYAFVMQSLIDQFYRSDKLLAFKLMGYIEQDKTMALTVANSHKLNNVSRIKNNPSQHRFGLLPNLDSMPLKKLLHIILVDEGVPIKTEIIPKLANSLNVGFIIFNKIVYNPVEFNIRSLIEEEIANRYKQPAACGITDKIIERFNTIRPLAGTDKWDFSIEIHNEKANKFYIMETLNGTEYRVLTPWVKSTKFAVARFRIEHILTHSTEPSRATKYHSIMVDKSIPNMFIGKLLDLESMEMRYTELESDKIRVLIMDDIVDTIKKIVKNEYANDIKSPLDVSDIIHNLDIVNTYINSSIIHYAAGTDGYDAGVFNMSEILTTFVVMLQKTGRRLSRELHNRYSRNPLNDRDLSGKKNERYIVAVEKITEIVKDSLNLIIKLDDNPFVHIYTKYLKLNFAI